MKCLQQHVEKSVTADRLLQKWLYSRGKMFVETKIMGIFDISRTEKFAIFNNKSKGLE